MLEDVVASEIFIEGLVCRVRSSQHMDSFVGRPILAASRPFGRLDPRVGRPGPAGASMRVRRLKARSTSL